MESSSNLLVPENFVVYRCINNGAQLGTPSTDLPSPSDDLPSPIKNNTALRLNIALKIKPKIIESEKKLQERREKYERFNAGIFHVLFEPTEYDEIGEKVQEIRDGRNLKSRTNPFDETNTQTIQYHDGDPIEDEDWKVIQENITKASTDKSYFKLHLTFHASFFVTEYKDLNRYKIENFARRIKEAIISSGVNYAEIILNSCNSDQIMGMIYDILNEESPTKFSVKGSTGVVLAEAYDASISEQSYNKIIRDNRVRNLREGDFVEFSELSADAKLAITELCQRGFRCEEKKKRIIPVLIDNYVIIDENPSRVVNAKFDTKAFCGGHKVLFNTLWKSKMLIPDKSRLEWKREGDKIIPESVHEQYLLEHQKLEDRSQQDEVDAEKVRSKGYLRPTTSSLLKERNPLALEKLQNHNPGIVEQMRSRGVIR